MAADRALTVRPNGFHNRYCGPPAMGQLLQMFRLHGCTRGSRANGIFAAVCAAVNNRVNKVLTGRTKGRHKANKT